MKHLAQKIKRRFTANTEDGDLNQLSSTNFSSSNDTAMNGCTSGINNNTSANTNTAGIDQRMKRNNNGLSL